MLLKYNNYPTENVQENSTVNMPSLNSTSKFSIILNSKARCHPKARTLINVTKIKLLLQYIIKRLQ